MTSSYAWGVEVMVTNHAMWRAAERCPDFDTVEIEDEVRAALAAGRVTSDRTRYGLTEGWTPRDLFAATEDGGRVYVIRPDIRNQSRLVVVTTMTPLESGLPRNPTGGGA